MTSIEKLKKIEYLEGSRLTLENFKDLLSASETLADKKKYGTASSICVLAFEELAKAIVLKLRGIDNSIPIKNVEKYFINHEPKQNLGINIFTTISSYYENNSETQITNPDQIIAMLLVLLIFASGNIELKKTYFDKIKETGLYVSFDKSLRKWKNPRSEHNEETFNELLEFVIEFYEKIEHWIFNDKINKENILEFLDKLDDSIIDKSRLKKLKTNSC